MWLFSIQTWQPSSRHARPLTTHSGLSSRTAVVPLGRTASTRLYREHRMSSALPRRALPFAQECLQGFARLPPTSMTRSRQSPLIG